MTELLELLMPLVIVIFASALYTRWKQKSELPFSKLILGHSLRLGVALLNIILCMILFVGFLKVTDFEMMIISAVVFGVSYSAMSYFFPLSEDD